jgi:hypothetical protein
VKAALQALVRAAEHARVPGPGWLREHAGAIYLTGLILVIGGLNLLWTSHAIQANNRDRCTTVVQLAHIPIPRPVAGNPSREFAAATEAIYRNRARQLGCM